MSSGGEDIPPRLAFCTTDAISSRASGRTISIIFRNGQKLDAQFAYAPNENDCKKQLPAGFAESKARWADITPSSLLTVFATAGDAKNADTFTIMRSCAYQAIADRPATKTRSAHSPPRQPRSESLESETDTHIKWLSSCLIVAVILYAVPSSV